MNDQGKQYQQLIAKCWVDPAFKQRLLADPAGTLKAEGIEVPEGVRVQVAENAPQEFTLVIPEKPADISDDVLTGIAAGSRACHPPEVIKKYGWDMRDI